MAGSLLVDWVPAAAQLGGDLNYFPSNGPLFNSFDRSGAPLVDTCVHQGELYVCWVEAQYDSASVQQWARGPYVAGAVIVAAGVYELTPLKGRSLRRCRNARHPYRALDSGLAHGVDCVTCSGGLMAVLFVVGVMSLFWMALVAVAIFAEKVLQHGSRLIVPLAVALVALGIWVGVSPASVPGLTQPGSMKGAL